MRRCTLIRTLVPMLLTMMALGAAAARAQDGGTLRCDFTGGIPEDFTLIDGDGNTPSVDVASYGFGVGTPWVAYYDGKEKNYVAASTSWYAASGTSDDWMILPPLTVGTADAALSWRAKATDPNFSDGYAVYVSEAGAGTSDFDKARPLFATAAESAQWANHYVSLAAYEGKTIRIAFVNNSTDCSLLYIDDIFAGTPLTVRMETSMKPLVKPTDEIVIQGRALTDLDEPVRGFTVGYECDGKTACKEFADADITPYTGTPFAVATGDKLPAGEERTYNVWIEAGGKRYDTEVTLASRHNKVVAEELTGTWCGYCVRGIATMADMKREHPDTFIPIAVHGGDFLTDYDYQAYIGSISSYTGYPYSITNRDKTAAGDPEDIPAFYERKAGAEIAASVAVTATAENGGYSATADVTLNDNCNDGRYRMAYTIVENDVYEDGNGDYAQKNYYSGGGLGPMGGFEDMPEVITDYHFQDVCRGAIGDIEGIEGSLPRLMSAGRTYSHTLTFALPGSVLNADNAYIVAMLVDKRNGNIINADMAKLTGGEPTGIADAADCAGPDRTELFTIGGGKARAGALSPGVYIRRTVRGGKATVEKVVAR